MRFSRATLLALPVLAAAVQENTWEAVLDDMKFQAKTHAQFWMDKVTPWIPNPNKPHTPEATAAKAGGKSLNILTLGDWEHTIRSSVKAQSTTPEEWWVLVTGGNKTCFGHCTKVETAFNETALLWSVNPKTPNLGYLNCDNQPVLCNSWGAGPPSLWMMDVSAPGKPVDIRVKPLNATTTEVNTFTDLFASQSYKKRPVFEGYFHPFDGQLAQYGVAVPLGYIFWVFAIVPSWMFMIGLSFISRTIISSRAADPTPRAHRTAPAAGGAAPAERVRVGAPPGDARPY